MKIDRKLLALLMIVFCALALIVGIPSIFGNNAELNDALKNARAFYEEDLCVKALAEYEKALSAEDTLSLRLEMADVYLRAYENGEIRKRHVVEDFLVNTVGQYHKEVASYDKAIGFLCDVEDYIQAIELIRQADGLGLKSEKIEEYREKVRYTYQSRSVILTLGQRSMQGTYVVSDGEGIYVYDDDFKDVFGQSFEYASPYTNGYVLVRKNNTTYLLDVNGIRQAYFPNEITEATGVGDGLIACCIGSKYAYYDLSGEKQFGTYLFAGRFVNGIAAVQTEKGWQLIDTSGNPIMNKFFEDIKLGVSYECNCSGRIWVKENGKYILYDEELKRVSAESFEDCDVFFSKNDPAAVKVGEKWGYIDSNGETVIKPQYELGKSFSNGLATVHHSEECSIINLDGQAVISGTFEDADYFSSKGLCLIKHSTVFQLIERYYVESE